MGGLVGANAGVVGGSYAAVEVSGETSTGGLAGTNAGRIAGSYATGRVSGTRRVGGLVGYNRGVLSAGYATGRVSGDAETGGLVGLTELPGRVTDGYWDTETSGRPLAEGAAATSGQGQSTSALQAPADYAGLYAAWDVDVDGDGVADAPWHFGTDVQYPALLPDVDGDGAVDVGRDGVSAPDGPGGDGGAGVASGAGGADVAGGRRERVDAVAGGHLHGLPRHARCGGDGRVSRRRPAVCGPRCGAGRRLHVPGGGGGRRRRGGAQRAGDGRGAVRVYGVAVAPGRAVAGGNR